MTVLPARFYQFGDKVTARWSRSGQWTPGRVISTRDDEVKVAASTPFMLGTGVRVLPQGTPIFKTFTTSELRLDCHDPGWDPYAVEPFMTPAQYVVLGGCRGWPNSGLAGLTQVGAYMSGTWYETNDPVWAWEDGWRRAVVISGQRSWIAVRYADGYRLGTGRRSKSYRPPQIWPVLCDHPEAVRKIIVDEEWSQVPNY